MLIFQAIMISTKKHYLSLLRLKSDYQFVQEFCKVKRTSFSEFFGVFPQSCLQNINIQSLPFYIFCYLENTYFHQ